MNKNYLYNGTEVTVVDSRGNVTQTSNYANLEERLIQENVIETVIKIIEELTEKSKAYNRVEKKFFPKVSLFLMLGIILAFSIIYPLFDLSLYGTDVFTNPIMTPGGPVSYVSNLFTKIIGGVIAVELVSLPVEITSYLDDKSNKKKIEDKIELLKRRLEKEKQKLDELEKDEKISGSKEPTCGVVKDKKRINEATSCLKLYDMMIAGETPSDKYSEETIDIVTSYLDQSKSSGPTRTRKIK